MSGIDSAASMFLSSGNIPAATPDASRPFPREHHSMGCDVNAAEHHQSRPEDAPVLCNHSKLWAGEENHLNFQESFDFRSALRSSLPPQLKRDDLNALDMPSTTYPIPSGAIGANPMHSIADCGIKALQFLGAFSRSLKGRVRYAGKTTDLGKASSQYVQEVIRALQNGGSRMKMEAATAVRSLAASHNFGLIAAGGLRPLVKLLSYEAGEIHWPLEMRKKATITVRAEAALALASLSVSNDENKGAIGAAGAIPLLCDLIQFDEQSYNPTVGSYLKHEMAPFWILARDAGAAALSCLAKHEVNKDAIIAANAVPVLVRMVDQGTSFGRAAAANVLAKLSTGENMRNKVILGEQGAIPSLLRLIKQGSPKARETAAEALANLASNVWNKSAIIKDGGVDCLLKMAESSSQAEKDAASTTLKILQSSMELGSKQWVSTEHRNRLVSSRVHDISGEWQPNEVSAAAHQGVMSILHTRISGLSSPLTTMQTMFTSELTSSLAPPLVGQPSIQADAVLGYPKESYMAQSRKRLKVSHSSTNCGPRYTKIADSAEDDGGISNQVHNDQCDDKSRVCCAKSGLDSLPSQGFGCTTYAHPGMREGLEQCVNSIDRQPISRGIFALVNALSSQNPEAHEFAALALMLLASQGGFEIKTAIADAGGLPPLIAMVSSPSSPMIRESAAAAIAKLVSCHPRNRAVLIRAGGVRALVDMAKSSTTLPDGGGTFGARTQAAAIVALLSISDVLDKQTMGLGLREALPSLAHMLESDNLEEAKAGVGGLQALGLSLGTEPDQPGLLKEDVTTQEGYQKKKSDCLAIELVTSLLDLMQGSSIEAKDAAIDSLADLRKIKTFSSNIHGDNRETVVQDQLNALRMEGLDALLLLLQRGPVTAYVREIVAGTFACVVNSDRLHNYLVESSVVPHLMRLLQEGPTIETKVLAASAIANLGAKRKKLETISMDDMSLLLKLLSSELDGVEEPRAHRTGSYHISLPRLDSSLQRNNTYQANPHSAPYLLLREHAVAILVYTALSGETKKQSLVAAGAAPIFVRMLQACMLSAWINMLSPLSHPDHFKCVNHARHLSPVFSQATQEFAIMGLILLADKNVETMAKIVDAGGIPTLLKLLSATGGQGRLGASWTEMSAAALLTLPGCDAAREEIIRTGGITSLVQVLKGEGGTSVFSLTGLAAMAQLLGVLALNSSKAKLQMAKVGAVRCLVEILAGGGCLAWAAEGQGRTREGPGLVALAQEAAAAALATVVLHCPENAEAAVETGAIGPLIRLLGAPSTSDQRVVETPIPAERESGASSDETGLTNDNSAVKVLPAAGKPSNHASKEDTGGINVGGPLAAMAALGNMVSCFPRCGREIVSAGALPRLMYFLQTKQIPHHKDKQANDEVSLAPQCHSKLQESAALVLGLLAEGDADAQEVIGRAGVIPALIGFSSATKLESTSTASATIPSGEGI